MGSIADEDRQIFWNIVEKECGQKFTPFIKNIFKFEELDCTEAWCVPEISKNDKDLSQIFVFHFDEIKLRIRGQAYHQFAVRSVTASGNEESFENFYGSMYMHDRENFEFTSGPRRFIQNIISTLEKN